MKTLREKIEVIMQDETITDYRLAKETKLTLSVVQNHRSGKAKIDNIRLKTAEVYEKFYDKVYPE